MEFGKVVMPDTMGFDSLMLFGMVGDLALATRPSLPPIAVSRAPRSASLELCRTVHSSRSRTTVRATFIR